MSEALIGAALDAARTEGVRYADVRLVSPQRYLHLAVRDGTASSLTSSLAAGLGVRVRTARAWGFGATRTLTPASVRAAARTAVRLARAASRSARSPLPWTSESGPNGGRYATALREDPFAVSGEDVIALLADAERRLHVGPEVKSGVASFQAWDETKWFASSDGA